MAAIITVEYPTPMVIAITKAMAPITGGITTPPVDAQASMAPA